MECRVNDGQRMRRSVSIILAPISMLVAGGSNAASPRLADYAIGALSAGLIADSYGLSSAITSIAVLTFLSGAVVAVLMRNQKVAVDGPVTHSTDRSDATGGGQPLDNAV